MNDWRVPGFTSTGSKRPDALFGTPARMTRASGCRVWDEDGREYVDFVMALGAVALGYGHPAVNRAAEAAIAAGVVGPLPPVAEEELAEALGQRIPWLERVRFLKTGAEAVAAAVRLARVATGRDEVLGCGYHGWLDWCQGATEGVPPAVRGLFAELPFDDVAAGRELIRARAPRLAAVVIEPVVVTEPSREWLQMLRAETQRAGAILIFDEIKTAFRLAIGGAAERYGVRPDLAVVGKALANGFPLAAVGGRADLMAGATRTWISSTLATEGVALAAARAT
ncbi:MAG TPA: aminotransferase class III-fold pyridoxal phosphate-dependent enzyme, partial [Gemmatimonadales bacterium]|nr:aminotransferase class III-fold pyridoxal phosphate-dependent enzyme [Gemmatimonadales bacterium]